MNNTLFYGLFLALAIVLTVLGSIVINGSNKISDSTVKTNTQNSGTGVLIIGLVFLLGSAWMLYSSYSKSSGSFYYF